MARTGDNRRCQIQIHGKINPVCGNGLIYLNFIHTENNTKQSIMKTRNFIMLSAAFAFMFAACEKENGSNAGNGSGNGGDGQQTDETVQTVSGVWESGTTVNVDKHLLVPEGESLTIEPGVTVIFSSEGVGINHVPIEFTVDGNLYCLGTEDQPVLLTVAEVDRTYANTFAALWGGIVAGATCEEMIIDHTVIEYTGGEVVEGSPAAENGYYTAGDDAYPQITTNNVNGKYVITNSIIRNGWSDGIYMMGGNAIIANNIFSATGYDGAEAVNVKSGCKVDVAGNIMFSPNTNGLKLSSSDQDEVRHQALIQAYNNTIINSGWRRDGEKGGCIYVEEMANVSVFNNLLVNCKFRAITPAYGTPTEEDCYDREHSMIDYNFYASGTVKVSEDHYFGGEYEDDGEILEYSGVWYAYEGYAFDHAEYDNEKVDANSKIAKTETDAKSLDPKFVNYSLDADPSLYQWNDSWDFHVQAGSPVLEGAYTPADASRKPFYAESGLSVNGKTYTSPAVQPYFGAFGTK